MIQSSSSSKTRRAFKNSRTSASEIFKATVSTSGRVRAIVCDPSKAPAEYAEVNRLLAIGGERIKEALTSALDAYHKKAKVSEKVFDNITTTVGRAQIANAMWDSAVSPRISYIELGTGTNTPAIGDTALQTPVYRNALASGNNVSNVVRLTGFFNQVETTGTYREAGMFMGGSGTIGTGTLSSRVAINITKTGSESLTIEWEVTIADA